MLRLCIRGDYVIELVKKYKIILIIILMLTANICIVYYQDHKAKEEAILLIEEPILVKTEESNEKPMETIVDKEVPVYICGAVQHPGVYFIKQPVILQTVLEMAGGGLEEADLTAINLARALSPHEKIYVPKIGEEIDKFAHSYENSSEIGSSESGTSTLININQADLETLKGLPGIGEVKARQIIDYRKAQGPFKTKDEIQNVSGIGEKTYLLIEQMITIE